MSQTRPVVVFAFANDRVEHAHYLRNLPEELRQIRAAMAGAVDAGLCEVVPLPNATAAEVLDVFQRYRDRVAIFHYGGHAGGAGLLLESADGNATMSHADGLALILGEQRSLELVFLNGCSSAGQVQDLLAVGVPAVLATSQAIDDGVAVEFSARFYKALASGASLKTSFIEAQAAVRTRVGHVRETYRSFVPDLVGEERWPWDLYPSSAEERLTRWSLPRAARNPLFGVPPPPPMVLPSASPFKHLDWFSRGDAEIFFGRGREIHELYDAVTAPGAAPIVLLFGATGVGKSSLLSAGLAPRLGESHEVIYLRRKGARGLAGTLAGAFRAEVVSGNDLREAWWAREAAGKPLVVVLDQAEEAWTRTSSPAGEREAKELAAALHSMFAVQDKRPRGRLILSFRKEWLADVLRHIEAEALPHFPVEVTPLDRDAIAEIVAGPASSDRLRQQYRLEVQPELPELIADDLLEDPGSAVAPALQILLTKMWNLAKKASPGRPHFTVELYQQLKRKGNLLDHFLEEQLAELKDWRRELVESGLLLDLLAHHTTPLGTAEAHEAARVVERYEGHPFVVELLQQCKDRYLLAGTARVQQGDLVSGSDDPRDKGTTRLAHDTLAPLVRQRFELSVLPGQRASRVLQQRAVDWAEGKEGPLLGEVDLSIVEQGKDVMRVWTTDEKRLVKKSQRERERRRRRQRNLQWAGVLAVLIIASVAVVAWWQRSRAEEEARTARRVTEFLQSMFQELDPRRVALNKNALPQILDRSTEKIETDLASEPVAQDQLRETIGTVYLNLGVLDKAENLLQEVVAFRRRTLGREHPDTLVSMNKLANVYYFQSHPKRMEDLHCQILEIRRRVLGSEHLDTLASMTNLAIAYYSQGRLGEAEELHNRVLEIRQRVQGHEHPDTLTSMTNLANVHQARGRLEEAEGLYRQGLTIRRRVQGEEHPDTLALMNNLAIIYSARGLLKDAEDLHGRVLATRREVLGDQHPDTLGSMANLADVYSVQGAWDKAEKLGRQALEGRRRVLGEEHPKTAVSMMTLANVYFGREHFDKAEKLYSQALEISRRVSGEEHTDTLAVKINLMNVYHAQHRLAKAEKLGRETLETLRRVVGTENPNTLRLMTNLANVYLEEGRLKEAESLARDALERCIRVLGEQHPDTLNARSTLAAVDEALSRTRS